MSRKLAGSTFVTPNLNEPFLNQTINFIIILIVPRKERNIRNFQSSETQIQKIF